MCCKSIQFAKRSISEKDDIVPPYGPLTPLGVNSVDRFLEDPHSERQVKVSNLQGVEQTWWFDKKLRIPGAEGNLGNKKEHYLGRHAGCMPDVCQFFGCQLDLCCDESSFSFEFGLKQTGQ